MSTEKGRRAEEVALEYFLQRGFCFLGKNVRTKVGEIDLILRLAGLLLFVEVKGRKSDWEHSAWQPLWRGKKRRLAQAIRFFLERERLQGVREIRLDIVFVTQGRVAEHFSDEFLSGFATIRE